MKDQAAPPGFLERHYHILRRLHSLTGIIPLGAFMLAHLTTNSAIVWGAINTGHGSTPVERTVGTFQEEVYFIHKLPFLIFSEIFVLWLPLLFHSVLGFVYARSGKHNTDRYPYQGNWRYSLQRISGYIGFAFVFYHVATLRWHWTFLVPGGTRWEYAYAASTLAAVLRGGTSEITLVGLAISAFYFIGVTMLVYHFANGLWTAAITWGLTVSVKAQRRWGYFCAAAGVMLMAMGWSSVVGFALLSHDQALRIENRIMPVDVRNSLEEMNKLHPNPGEAQRADRGGR